MLFNVTEAVNFIVDDSQDRYFRAIKLFELHVAIRLADGCDYEEDTNDYEEDTNEEGSSPLPILVYVSTPRMHQAQMFATIRLMEHIERQVKKEKGEISVEVLNSNCDWKNLYDMRFLQFGGFRRTRYLPRPGDFDNAIWVRRGEAKKVAHLIDFSLRVELDPTKPKQKGGMTMAKAIVAGSRYFNVKRSERTLQTYWKRLEPVAAFLPLIFFKKFPAWPLRVSRAKFAKKLLARLDDKDSLFEFFAEYNATVARLQKRGYSLRSLAGFPASQITFQPLPEKVKEKVGAYGI
jgi:hypothetical protein